MEDGVTVTSPVLPLRHAAAVVSTQHAAVQVVQFTDSWVHAVPRADADAATQSTPRPAVHHPLGLPFVIFT